MNRNYTKTLRDSETPNKTILSISITGTLQIRGAFRLETGTTWRRKQIIEVSNVIPSVKFWKIKAFLIQTKKGDLIKNLWEHRSLKFTTYWSKWFFEASAWRRTVKSKTHPNPRNSTQLNWTENLWTMPSMCLTGIFLSIFVVHDIVYALL